jgi:hypothetical protein
VTVKADINATTDITDHAQDHPQDERTEVKMSATAPQTEDVATNLLKPMIINLLEQPLIATTNLREPVVITIINLLALMITINLSRRLMLTKEKDAMMMTLKMIERPQSLNTDHAQETTEDDLDQEKIIKDQDTDIDRHQEIETHAEKPQSRSLHR